MPTNDTVYPLSIKNTTPLRWAKILVLKKKKLLKARNGGEALGEATWEFIKKPKKEKKLCGVFWILQYILS